MFVNAYLNFSICVFDFYNTGYMSFDTMRYSCLVASGIITLNMLNNKLKFFISSWNIWMFFEKIWGE